MLQSKTTKTMPIIYQIILQNTRSQRLKRPKGLNIQWAVLMVEKIALALDTASAAGATGMNGF